MARIMSRQLCLGNVYISENIITEYQYLQVEGYDTSGSDASSKKITYIAQT